MVQLQDGLHPICGKGTDRSFSTAQEEFATQVETEKQVLSWNHAPIPCVMALPYDGLVAWIAAKSTGGSVARGTDDSLGAPLMPGQSLFPWPKSPVTCCGG
jgi:hypothetical protein